MLFFVFVVSQVVRSSASPLYILKEIQANENNHYFKLLQWVTGFFSGTHVYCLCAYFSTCFDNFSIASYNVSTNVLIIVYYQLSDFCTAFFGLLGVRHVFVGFVAENYCFIV